MLYENGKVLTWGCQTTGMCAIVTANDLTCGVVLILRNLKPGHGHDVRVRIFLRIRIINLE